MKVEALDAAEARKAKAGKPFRVVCAWFAGCRREARGVTRHVILGDVPTCDACHKFATGEQR